MESIIKPMTLCLAVALCGLFVPSRALAQVSVDEAMARMRAKEDQRHAAAEPATGPSTEKTAIGGAVLLPAGVEHLLSLVNERTDAAEAIDRLKPMTDRVSGAAGANRQAAYNNGRAAWQNSDPVLVRANGGASQAASDRARSLEDQANNLAKMLLGWENKKRRLNSEIRVIQKTIPQQRAALKEPDIIAIREKLALLEKQRGTAMAKIDDLDARLSSLRNEKPANKSDVTRQEAESANLQTQGQDWNRKIERLAAQISVLREYLPAERTLTGTVHSEEKLTGHNMPPLSSTPRFVDEQRHRLAASQPTAIAMDGQHHESGPATLPTGAFLDRAYTDTLLAIQKNGIDPPQPEFRGFREEESRLIASNGGKKFEIYQRGGLRLARELWGKSDVFCAHPYSPQVPAYIDFSKITSMSDGTLNLHFHNFPTGDCEAVVRVDGKDIATVAVAHDKWKDVRVPFHMSNVGVEVRATGWWNEHAFITYEIEAGQGSAGHDASTGKTP